MTKYKLVIPVLVLAVLACQTPVFTAQQNPADTTNQSTTSEVIPTIAAPTSLEASNPAAAQDVLVTLFETVSPGTVAIFTQTGQGSGFVYDTQGHIVTNLHVVASADDNTTAVDILEVRFPSGFIRMDFSISSTKRSPHCCSDQPHGASTRRI